MLKLKDFELLEVNLNKIQGGDGGGNASIWNTKTYVMFLGFLIETGTKCDGCNDCDAPPPPPCNEE